ncbi:hypothetical protein [uncultured Winogradskyella sp.]|uniref:hypothetical protein n=1 Tax=uncultured Winogradskyella sp. TaxID=395353 RepID=UPI00263887C5|nr:hypothetical protein [uncultured Winogradskyella sp.]
MENFLRKIKLIDSFSTTLNTSKSDFTSALRNHVDEAEIDSFFSGVFEMFSSSENKFKGLVSHSGFKIRKRRRFFERNFGKAIAKGNLREQGDKLVINTEINAFNNYMIFMFGALIVFYLVFFIIVFGSIFSENSELPVFVPIFVLVHAVFMFGIPYFIMRKGVRRMKQDLEREFHFIISKSHSLR